MYISGPVIVPTTLNPIVAAGPGAYTAVASAVLGPNVIVPGNVLGNNGELTFEAVGFQSTLANTKYVNPGFGGALFRGRRSAKYTFTHLGLVKKNLYL